MIERSYQIDEGQFGTKVITVYGRCDGSNTTVEAIEGNCTARFKLVPLPHARGVFMKSFDGVRPTVVTVEPSTIDRKYECVKISGRVWPMAPKQEGGRFEGETVLHYEMVFQQVGDLS